MNCQQSMMYFVLLIVQLFAQTSGNNCPPVDLCDYVTCTNGQCIRDTTLADCYRCQCPPGFTGQLCEIPIVTPTGCNPPCQNGGTCMQNATSTFFCACPSNFTGQQCETSIIATHPCVTMPNSVCQNGGTCTINGANYLCNCPIGFTGQNCETQEATTTCTPNLCGAHGTCQQYVSPTAGPIAVCICQSQWTGRFCDTSLSTTCTPDYCQNGGTCVQSANGPYCVCSPLFTGLNCQIYLGTSTTSTSTVTMTTMTTPTSITTSTATATTPAEDCSTATCLNGGTCYNTGNGFFCFCRTEFSGPTCAAQNPVTTMPLTTSTAPGPNACSSNPCNNGGTCYKYGSSFVCVCTSQYAGQTCDAIKTTVAPSSTVTAGVTCANQPCQNGGTCYNAGTSYFCYCGANSNYTGTNCDVLKVTSDPGCPLNCSPGYCVRAGTGQNTYACMCNGTLTPNSCSRN